MARIVVVVRGEIPEREGRHMTPAGEIQRLKAELAARDKTIAEQRQLIEQLQRRLRDRRAEPNDK